MVGMRAARRPRQQRPGLRMFPAHSRTACDSRLAAGELDPAHTLEGVKIVAEVLASLSFP
jgi:hypothetical protein